MKKIMDYKWTLLIGLAITLVVNYLLMFGLFGNLTQAEVSNRYVNLFAPAGITFSIWGIIYIMMGLVVYSEFKYEKNPNYLLPFRKKIKPLMLIWMILNILWNIFWVAENILFSLIIIVAYLVVLSLICHFIVTDNMLYKEALFLRWPSGFHLGWLVVAFFANVMTFIAKLGLDLTEIFGVALAIIFIILVLVLAAMLAVQYSNAFVMLPPLWAIFGIILKHLPESEFVHKNVIVQYGAMGLLGIGVFVLAAMLFRGDLTRAS